MGYLLEESRAEMLAKRVSAGDIRSLAITRAEIFLTSRCNMNCCYCQSMDHRAPEWNLDELFRLMDQLVSTGARHLQWTGGEVSLHPCLKSLITRSHQAGMTNSISTNGTAGFEYYVELADAGVTHFFISAGPPDPDFFEIVTRTSGQYERIRDTIARLCRYSQENQRCRVIINTVLTRKAIKSFMADNARQLREYLHWCMEIGAYSFKFLPVSTEPLNELFPDSGEKNRFFEICTDIIPANAYPMFRYRLSMLLKGGHGLFGKTYHACYHCLDDRAFDSEGAFSCIIHLREKGEHLYYHSDPESEKQCRLESFIRSNRVLDPLCRKFCFDLYRALSEVVENKLRS